MARAKGKVYLRWGLLNGQSVRQIHWPKANKHARLIRKGPLRVFNQLAHTCSTQTRKERKKEKMHFGDCRPEHFNQRYSVTGSGGGIGEGIE